MYNDNHRDLMLNVELWGAGLGVVCLLGAGVIWALSLSLSLCFLCSPLHWEVYARPLCGPSTCQCEAGWGGPDCSSGECCSCPRLSLLQSLPEFTTAFNLWQNTSRISFCCSVEIISVVPQFSNKKYIALSFFWFERTNANSFLIVHFRHSTNS